MTESKIAELNHRAWELRFSDAAQALKLSKEAFQLSLEAENQQGQARSMRTMSYCHLMSSDYKQALDDGHRALQLFAALNDSIGQSEVTRTISRIHWNLGDFATALEFNLRTLKFAEASGDRDLLAHTYNNTAMNYARLENFEKVEEMVVAALEIFEALDNNQGISIGNNNLAMLHFSAERYQKALDFALTAYAHAQQVSDVNIRINVLDTLGQIYTKLECYAEALEYLETAHHIARSAGAKSAEMYAKLNIGRIYLQQNDPEKALGHALCAFDLAQTLAGEQMLLDCHELLASVYKTAGQLEKTIHHQEKHHQLYRAIFTRERDDRFAKLEVRYQTRTAQREAKIYRQKNDELQHEIIERQKAEAALIRARDLAEVANQAKSRFIANISHELRTPLNGVLGYTQLLLHEGTLLPVEKERVQIINESGSHLLTLINDLLDISKIEAKKVTLESTDLDLTPFLTSLIDMMRLSAEQKKLRLLAEIAADLPPTVIADQKRLRQVLVNLLGNAIKFTLRGQVLFRVTPVQRAATSDHTLLRFEVIDSGIGIQPEDVQKIFDPFEQAGSQQVQSSGTGLGLAISKEIVSLMGGTLCVESSPGVGSRFWFELALQPVASTAPKWHPPAISEPVPNLLVLPQRELCERLMSLAQSGDLFALANKLDDITIPALSPFVAAVRTHIESFDDQAIIDLLQDTND